MTIESDDGGYSLAPEEALGPPGNETRVGILQTLWDTFESGKSENALSYPDLSGVDYDDSGSVSYHLEKLMGRLPRLPDLSFRPADPRLLGVVVFRESLDGLEYGHGIVDDSNDFHPIRS